MAGALLFFILPSAIQERFFLQILCEREDEERFLLYL